MLVEIIAQSLAVSILPILPAPPKVKTQVRCPTRRRCARSRRRPQRDGGYRFGAPVLRAIGREGEGRRAIAVNRLGLANDKGYRLRLRVSDPRPVILFGADISNVQTRTA